jgi:hypothetical protein
MIRRDSSCIVCKGTQGILEQRLVMVLPPIFPVEAASQVSEK